MPAPAFVRVAPDPAITPVILPAPELVIDNELFEFKVMFAAVNVLLVTSKEFKDRAVGSIILPYIKGDEVWGIAKIYDKDAMKEISEGEVSTSPSVVFDNTAGNTTLTTESGEPPLARAVDWVYRPPPQPLSPRVQGRGEPNRLF